MSGMPRDQISAAGRGSGRDTEPHALSGPAPRTAVRRPAPAGGDRPGDRARAEGLSVRRATVQPRCGAPGADAARDRQACRSTLGTTAIYVTHDQVEAMTMADKIVVLNAGHVEQFGTPLELYERPANIFVAGFIGSPKMNFVSKQDIAGQFGAASIGVRPEHIVINRNGQGWPGTIAIAEHLGSDTFLYVESDVGRITVRTAGELGLRTGDQVRLTPDPARIHRFDTDGAKASRSRPDRRFARCISKNSSWKGGWRWSPAADGALVLACVDALAEAGAKVVIADRSTSRCAEESPRRAQGQGSRGRDRADGRRPIPKRVAEVAECAHRASRQARYPGQQCRHRAIRDARPRRSPTSTGSTSSTSISTARSGAAGPSASICSSEQSGTIVNIGSMSGFIVNKPQEQSYYNASKAARASPDEVARGRMGRARRPGQRGGADLYQHTAQRIRRARTRRCTRPGSTARRWGGWARSTRSPRWCCSLLPTPRAC